MISIISTKAGEFFLYESCQVSSDTKTEMGLAEIKMVDIQRLTFSRTEKREMSMSGEVNARTKGQRVIDRH